MCGIIGAFSFRKSAFEITEPYVTRMRDAMTHRGPDGAGTWISPDHRVGLGHRRLSIIDLSDCAAQPMCNEDGSLWGSFQWRDLQPRRHPHRIGKYRQSLLEDRPF